jgi:hypothetical protein
VQITQFNSNVCDKGAFYLNVAIYLVRLLRVKNENVASLPLTKLYEIADAAVVGFFTVLWKEATRYFPCLAMISHALAAKPALGTTVRAGAIFEIIFFHTFHI